MRLQSHTCTHSSWTQMCAQSHLDKRTAWYRPTDTGFHRSLYFLQGGGPSGSLGVGQLPALCPPVTSRASGQIRTEGSQHRLPHTGVIREPGDEFGAPGAWPRVCPSSGLPLVVVLALILREVQEYLAGRRRRRQQGRSACGPAPSPTHAACPRPAPWAPPPAWSGSLRSPPRRAPPRAPPALQRRVPGCRPLPVAAGSAGGRRAPPAARPLGTPLPRRLPQTRTSPRARAGSACGLHRTWVGGARATGYAHGPTHPRQPPAPFQPSSPESPAIDTWPLLTRDSAPCSSFP